MCEKKGGRIHILMLTSCVQISQTCSKEPWIQHSRNWHICQVLCVCEKHKIRSEQRWVCLFCHRFCTFWHHCLTLDPVCFSTREESGQSPGKAGWLPEQSTSWWGGGRAPRRSIQPQISGWRWADAGWLQPAAQTSRCQGDEPVGLN